MTFKVLSRFNISGTSFTSSFPVRSIESVWITAEFIGIAGGTALVVDNFNFLGALGILGEVLLTELEVLLAVRELF